MTRLRARVHEGRLKLDAVVDLPENTEVELVAVPIDQGDDLDDDDRGRLHAALDEADAQFDRGEGIPAARVLAELRALHH